VAEKHEFQVMAKDYKKRLDEFLFAEFPDLSRLYLRELIRDEKCEVNGEWKNRGYLLKINDFVEVEVDRARQTRLQPERIPLEIVFEDEQILVVNKPSGMLVHPTVKVRTGTLLNALAFYLNDEWGMMNDESKIIDRNDGRHMPGKNEIEANSSFIIPHSSFKRAGLIHRLDKDTSGLVVIAKQTRAHRILSSHFQRKLIEKRYFALVEGIVKEDSGTIDAPIGRFAEERVWNIKSDGKRAVTNFWVRERFRDSTLLLLEPVTGRTNQLRIHCAAAGHPIIGDKKYGGREFSRLCLHAYRLAFWHPDGGRRLEFETDLPEEMRGF
jgi:23S rRNA pseudouridine1911/1915/1917 synthase